VELIALRGIKREPSTAEKRFATVHCATPLSGSGPLSLRADTLLLRRASSAIAFGSVPLCPCFWSRVNQIYHAGYWKLQAIPKVYTDADQPWSFVTVPETLGRSAIGAIGRHCRRISAMDEVVSHGIEVDGSSTQIIVSALPVKLYSKARLESSQSPKHNHRLTCHTRQGKTTYPLAARPPSFPPPPPSALAPRAKKYKNFSRLAI
jgi:hypothetical protein